MKKITLILMTLTLFSQVLGFGREVTLSFYYGASGISDAYLISLLIPGLIIGIIASGISSAYIPIYNKVLSTSGFTKGNIFTSQVINILSFLCLLLLVLCTIYLEEIIKVFAHGFNEETLSITKQLTEITLFSMFFIAVLPVFSGFLHSNKSYLIPALIGIPFNLIIILSIFLSHKGKISFLSYGFLVANIMSILIMIFFLVRKNFTHKLSMGIKDTQIKEITQLAIPVILGASFNQINILIDKTIASGVSVGGITSLHYANRINLSIDSIITISFMVIFFPLISKLIAENNKEEFRKKIRDYILWISLLIIPSSVFLIFYSHEIISLLFGRGAFNADDVKITSEVLLYYSIGMIGIAITTILTKSCYALKDTGLPMKILLFNIVLNISFSIFLSKYIGINGLALGTSISVLFSSFVFYHLMKKKYTFIFNNYPLCTLLFKIFSLSILAAFLGKTIMATLNIENNYVLFFFSLLSSLSIYLMSIHFFHIFNFKKLLNYRVFKF